MDSRVDYIGNGRTCAISVTLWVQSTGKPRLRKSFRRKVTLPSCLDDVLELVCQATAEQVFIQDGKLWQPAQMPRDPSGRDLSCRDLSGGQDEEQVMETDGATHCVEHTGHQLYQCEEEKGPREKGPSIARIAGMARQNCCFCSCCWQVVAAVVTAAAAAFVASKFFLLILQHLRMVLHC